MGTTNLHREKARFIGGLGLGDSTAPAADAVPTITNTTSHLALNSTSGTKVILTGSGADAPLEGQRVTMRVDTLSGGAYTLAVVGGTLTLNSVGEAAEVKRVGSTWVAISLTPSSSTAANIATIV